MQLCQRHDLNMLTQCDGSWQVLAATKEKPLIMPTFAAFVKNHIRVSDGPLCTWPSGRHRFLTPFRCACDLHSSDPAAVGRTCCDPVPSSWHAYK